MKKIQLSERLRAAADMVSPGYRIADVGTDHGYLPIWLLLNEIVPSAIGMDINHSPLSRAKDNSIAAGVSGEMELRLSDGLSALKPGEADVITICGMGGPLICRILAAGQDIAKSAKELILSPQSDIPAVRIFLRTNGYQITDENMVCDGGKYYVIMKAVPCPNTLCDSSEMTLEDRFGPVLLKTRPKAFLESLLLQEKQNEQIISNLENAQKNTKNTDTLTDIYLQQKAIREILDYGQ